MFQRAGYSRFLGKMRRLLVVYNADAGRLHAAVDSLHKLISPATYSCDLCRLTHGPIRMKSAWRAFVESPDLPVRVIHRDEYDRRPELPEVALPAILLEQSGAEPVVLLDARTIGRVRSLPELMDLIGERLSVAGFA